MSFNRRLDRDEQAELDARPGAYTQEEMRMFEVLCARLSILGDFSGVVSDGCVTVHQCQTRCGKRVPAGIPSGWHRSKYDVCPACCKARRLVATLHKEPLGAVDRELDAYVIDEETEKAAFFKNLRKIGT